MDFFDELVLLCDVFDGFLWIGFKDFMDDEFVFVKDEFALYLLVVEDVVKGK